MLLLNKTHAPRSHIPALHGRSAAGAKARRHGFIFDTTPAIALELDNRPGSSSEVATRLGEERVNINYAYGSASATKEKGLFVFCAENLELAAKMFQ
jgi:hypothetical protein